MPKGQTPKLKGSICNVPIDTNDVTNILPRGANSNGIITIKLKQKFSFRGHVYFEDCPRRNCKVYSVIPLVTPVVPVKKEF